MRDVYIITNIFMDSRGEKLSVGGVETYLYNLCGVLKKTGRKVEIYQQSSIPFDIKYDGIRVHGLTAEIDRFVAECMKHIPKNHIVIFGNDEVVYGEYEGKTINIQHGIGWDLMRRPYRSELYELRYRISDFRSHTRRIRNSHQADCVVCVDYNYVNWFRTQINRVKADFVVIPNFTKIPDHMAMKQDDCINIIFARRFVEFRGTRIFTEAIRKILQEYPQVRVTFAGVGPEEEWIREQLKDYPAVSFTQYKCDESLMIHSDKHIAVVPSVGSEGTSLSLLEAMASGCAVVCTNVGGMTNIVIDHYNGIMVSPKTDELYSAIKELVDSKELRAQLRTRAYDTVKHAFSYEKWAESWTKVLQKLDAAV